MEKPRLKSDRELLLSAAQELRNIRENQVKLHTTLFNTYKWMVQIHKNFNTLANLVGHTTSSHSSDIPQIEDIGAFDVPSWEDMQTRSLPMSPPRSKENFHNHIMHLKNDPFGLDMQDTLLTMTKTQFDEIQEESAKVILPVLHSLSSDQGSEHAYQILISNLLARFPSAIQSTSP